MLQLFIVLLTILVTSGAECPSMCTCRHLPREPIPTSYLYYTSIKCQGFGSNITLDNNTRFLEVADLNEESLNGLLQTLTNSLVKLNCLVLTNSPVIGSIDSVLNCTAGKVESVTLTHSNLSFIPPMFNGTKTVNLSNNNLTVLPSRHPLQSVRTLEALDLSVNNICTLATNCFHNLPQLKTLVLSQNNIDLLTEGVFDALISLNHLNLSHNQIRNLSENIFSSLLKLQHLDISWNNLARIAPGCLQLPSLARVVLSGNKQLGYSREFLYELGQILHTVDASRNGLKQVPQTLTRSIRTLKLSENVITSVRCGDLDAYPLLQNLDLSGNNVTNVEEDALGRLDALSVLCLSDNKLSYIPKSLPKGINILRLEGNQLEKLSKDDFEGLSTLEVLLLQDNKIKSVEGDALCSLQSLVTLDLSRNPIKSLHPGSLSGPQALEILRLSGIDTVSPAEDVSFPLLVPDHLVILDLSRSAGLARQLLADTAALTAVRELQELDISGAGLQFIPEDLLHFMPELRVIHIEDNKLNCSNLHYLAMWMRRQDREKYRTIICANPPDLWGVAVVDLQPLEILPIKQINHVEVQKAINFVPQVDLERKNETGISQRIDDNMTNDVGRMTKLPALDSNDIAVYGNTQLSTKSTPKKELYKKDVISSVKKPLVSSVDEEFFTSTPRKEYFAIGTVKLTEQNSQAETHEENPTNSSLSERPTSSNTFLYKALISAKDPRNLTSYKGPTNLSIVTTVYSEDLEMRLPIEANMDVQTWNASTIKPSMYRNSDVLQSKSLHPTMVILTICVLLGAVVLMILAARFNSRKRNQDRIDDPEEIPVTSISSITELW